jgi:branched-chain amino acid transport system permease protein
VFETLVLGLTIGSGLALMALGLTLVFGVMRTINFSHGELYTLGGYVFVALAVGLGVPPLLGIFAAPVLGAGLGWAIHAALLRVRPTFSRFGYADYFLIVTFAVSISLQNGFLLLFGADFRSPPSVLETDIEVFGATIGGDRLAGVIGAALAVAAVSLYMRRSYVGRSWRAISQNRLGAEVVGIDVAKGSRSAFAVASGLAALAGALLAPLFSVFPSAGVTPLSTAFTIIVLGGMGSVPGALIGGLLVGVVDTLGVVYVSSAYTGAYGFLLMIAVLLVRPHGLFGKRGRVV